MTKPVHTNPVITKDILDYLEKICDVPALQSDDDNALRWKAAQRDIYLRAKFQYEQSMMRPNTGANAAAQLGIEVRHEE